MNNGHWVFIFFCFLVVVTALIFSYVSELPDGKLHIVFCDVGQGDGIYIQFPDGADMVLDGGPGKKILTCLGTYMGFWDRSVELVALTHPQEDHYGGLQDIIERYHVSRIIIPKVLNNTDSYKTFISTLEKHKVKTFHVNTGDKIQQHNTGKIYQKDTIIESDPPVPMVTFDILWPREAFVQTNTIKADSNSSNSGENSTESYILSAINEAEAGEDLNNFSLVMHLSFGSFDALFTGDAEKDIVEGLLDGERDAIEVLKVPHHGSKDAVTTSFLNAINPALAVLSVGKKNSYGHPDENIVRLLVEKGVQVKRTDTDGSIEIVSDGKEWWIE